MEVSKVYCNICEKEVGYTPGSSPDYFDKCPYMGKKKQSECDNLS